MSKAVPFFAETSTPYASRNSTRPSVVHRHFDLQRCMRFVLFPQEGTASVPINDPYFFFLLSVIHKPNPSLSLLS